MQLRKAWLFVLFGLIQLSCVIFSKHNLMAGIDVIDHYDH